MACSSLFVLGNALRLRQFAVPSRDIGEMHVAQAPQTVFAVSDMTCGHCADRVRKAALSVAPGSEVQVDLPSGDVTLTPAAADPAAVAKAITDAGYPAAVK
jgi:copper chaperone CopZ